MPMSRGIQQGYTTTILHLGKKLNQERVVHLRASSIWLLLNNRLNKSINRSTVALGVMIVLDPVLVV